MTATSYSPTRRNVIAGSVATGAVSLLAMSSVSVRSARAEAAVLPFRVDVSNEDLANLRRRLLATRWPTKELVEDRSQGVQLATLQALARHWATDILWFEGGHLAQIGRADALRTVRRSLGALAFEGRTFRS